MHQRGKIKIPLAETIRKYAIAARPEASQHLLKGQSNILGRGGGKAIKVQTFYQGFDRKLPSKVKVLGLKLPRFF